MRLVATLSVLLAVWLALGFAPGAAAEKPISKQAVAQGSGGAIASDSTYATQAGLSVLRRGGTAADAAVAVASTLGVTDPYVAGIGGGGFFVHYDARTHAVSTIDGRETTPASDGATMFLDANGAPLPFARAVTSGLSVGVPGNLATWQKALDRWGRRGLAADLRPAIKVARRGFTVDATMQELTRQNQARFAQFSSTSQLFLPGGGLPAVGSVLRNPDLAATYREIARNGIEALYGGPIGRDIVNAVQHLPLAPSATLVPMPGPMTVQDLQDYRAIERAPTHVSYRGVDVYSMAPPSSRRLDRRRGAQRPRAIRPGQDEPRPGAASLPRVDAAGLRRPQPVRRRPRVRQRPARPAPVRQLRPAAGLPDRSDEGADQPRRTRRPERLAFVLGSRRREPPGPGRDEHEPLRGQRSVG